MEASKVKICVLLMHVGKLRQRLLGPLPRSQGGSLVPVEQVLGEAAGNGKEAMAPSPGLHRTDPLDSVSMATWTE